MLAGLQVDARAQAYVDEPNSLSAGLAYTYAPSGTLETMDMTVPNVLIFAHFITLSASYVTPLDGLQVEAELPLAIMKRGEGSFQHFPVPGEWDDGDTHYGLTDLKGGLRYQIKAIEQYFGLAFSAGGMYPTWDYPTIGFTAPGHHLWGIYGGVSIARTFDPIIPNLFFTTSYTYMHRSRVHRDETTEEFNRDYSEGNFQLGYFLPAGFTLAAAADWRLSHGGTTFEELIGEPAPVIYYHDQLLDEDFLLLGGDLGYQVSDSFDIGASVRFFVAGHQTRDQNLFGLSMNYRFF